MIDNFAIKCFKQKSPHPNYLKAPFPRGLGDSLSKPPPSKLDRHTTKPSTTSQKTAIVIYYKFMYSADILQLEFKHLTGYLNPG